MVDIFLIINILILQVIPIYPSKELKCCSETHFELCAKVCSQLGHSNQFGNKLHRIRGICPYGEERFWQCIRKHLNISKVLHSHRHCCLNAKTSACAVECFHSKTTNQIIRRCHSNEIQVRRCLNKYKIEKSCCGKGATPHCKNICKKVVASKIHNNSSTIVMLHRICKASPNVLRCLHVYGHEIEPDNPYLNCCKYGKTMECQRQCKTLFSTTSGEKDIVYKLNLICGPTNPQDNLYRCILGTVTNPDMHDESKVPTLFWNSNLLQGQCCTVAYSQTCKRWCYEIFSRKSFVSFDDPLYVQCMENPKEYELSTCIGDVLEPCKFGCINSMTFCSNFNNRPLELFRRCDTQADKTAERLFESWKNGDFSSLPAQVFVQNITLCEPKVWKALACILAIKPCSRKSNRNQICRSDCVSLLEKCLIKDPHDASKNAERICMILMPNPDQTDCITSSEYIEAKKGLSSQLVDAMFPCQNDPCKTNDVCSINDDCSFGRQSQNCPLYSCLPGCSLSASATIKIRNLSLFKVIFANNGKTCSKVCQCLSNEKRSVKNYNGFSCTNTTCYQNLPCSVNGKLREHNSRFGVENSFCTCFGGELICTRKVSKHRSSPNGQDLSCNCDMDLFNPVCGSNGITYPSICLARCYGLQDTHISPGACSPKDSCNPSPCLPSLVCMPRKRVCLHPSLFCPQYDCVEPKLTLAMMEPCLLDIEKTRECKKESFSKQCCKGNCHEKFSRSPVCGLDSVTYSSYCAAATQLVPVDYGGSCVATDVMQKDRCKTAQCNKRINGHCNSHVPIGGCCPICDPLIRVLFSHREAASHIEKVSPKPITVRDIIEQLSHYIHVRECVVRGYMSIEGDIIVLIQSTVPYRNSLRDKLCGRESERIASLINTRSPIISTNYYLSVVKAAFVQYPEISPPNKSLLVTVDLLTVLLLFAVVILFH